MTESDPGSTSRGLSTGSTVRSDNDPRYELVWNEALRSIAQQQALLESLRNRTGTLLSAAAIATSFLGGVAFEDGRVACPGWMAVIAFAICGGLSTWVLRPRGGWMFRYNANLLLDDYVEADQPCSLRDMQRDLSLHMETNHAENTKKLDRMLIQYQLATGALLIEIVAWLLELGGTN